MALEEGDPRGAFEDFGVLHDWAHEGYHGPAPIPIKVLLDEANFLGLAGLCVMLQELPSANMVRTRLVPDGGVLDSGL